MKLRRKWPAICIFCIFLIFDLVMIASCSFFSGLFPAKDIYLYIGGFTLLSVAIMGVLTFLLGKAADAVGARELSGKIPVKIVYGVLLAAIIIGGIIYRVEILRHSAATPTGKLSLYENAIINGQRTAEYDLLSIVYSKILSVVLLFTGNKLNIAFFFEIFLFSVFILCGAFAVRMLLGKLASLTFAAYTAFMPYFTDNLVRLKLTTDNLFLVLYGIELLVVAFYLKGVAKKAFRSRLFVIFYLLVGVVVGFMTYLDAGTFIMILPLLLAAPFVHEASPREEILRLLFVLLGAVCTFAGMIIQEAGFMQADVTLVKWAAYYFHNLNTFSVFWSYTDYKLIYIITLIVMSGVIVGFWKNREVEQVSPWLISLMIVFATVPFMGATRMNDQTLVTIYYAFILACVASLIVLPAKDEPLEELAEDELSDNEAVNDPAETEEINEAAAPKQEVITPEGISDVVKPSEPLKTIAEIKEDVQETVSEKEAEEVKEKEVKEGPKTVQEAPKEKAPRFVPEGMVVPEDDDDEKPREAAPRMKMPNFEGTISLNRKEINKALEQKEREDRRRAERQRKERRASEKAPYKKDDFDIAYREGDDFDI